MRDEPHQLSDQHLRQAFDELGFVTCSPNMIAVLRLAIKAAQVSDLTVLLEGETGTGKQVLAHGIHKLDEKRSAAPFVTVHCGTISEALAESELFGHHRGAFSGAVSDRKGLFASAQCGTLFLDDVNDLPYPLQAKLLDVLQRGALRPVGSDREVQVDVRIIAASNQPLDPLIRAGRFRSDLYHRLNVVKLFLPPLRDRSEDLADLVLAFARRYRHIYEPIDTVDLPLLTMLQMKPFFGNIRELENAVQRMLFLKTQGTSLGVPDWVAQSPAPAEDSADQDPFAEAADSIWKAISERGIPYPRAFQEIEKRVLKTAINASTDTRREIAKRLHTSERTLYYKMRVHGLGRMMERPSAASEPSQKSPEVAQASAASCSPLPVNH
jgi:two-component system response regulator PilR (NtrC family)